MIIKFGCFLHRPKIPYFDGGILHASLNMRMGARKQYLLCNWDPSLSSKTNRIFASDLGYLGYHKLLLSEESSREPRS